MFSTHPSFGVLQPSTSGLFRGDAARFSVGMTVEGLDVKISSTRATRSPTGTIHIHWSVSDGYDFTDIGSVSAAVSYTNSSSVESGVGSIDQSLDDAVNGAIGSGVAKAAMAIDRRLEKRRFQTSVRSLHADGVIVNAGLNLGVSVGDTFSVLRRLVHYNEGDAAGVTFGRRVGKMRVSEVSGETAFAQVIEKTGRLAVGDGLEWIGVFH